MPIFSRTPARITLPAVGRFHVGVRQPGVERKHRYLDGERQEKCAKQPFLLDHVQVDLLGDQHDIGRKHTDGLVEMKVNPDNGDQHEQGTHGGDK